MIEMTHKAFITNTKTKTLKRRIEQLIENSQELKFLLGLLLLFRLEADLLSGGIYISPNDITLNSA